MTDDDPMTLREAGQHPDGVYFGLPDDEYHADPALGSTDIRRLLMSGPDYWWNSPWNPHKPEEGEDSHAKIFGRAVHTRVLEGFDAFRARYAATYHNGNTKDGRKEREAIREAGKTPLRMSDYDAIALAGEMIVKNPYLGEAFSGGYPEVSVFWERDEVRRKCRLDYCKVRAIVDLKSIRNSREIDFVECVRRRFTEGRHDIQAAHYNEGREAMRSLIQEGRVHGEPEPSWLEAVAAQETWAFVFVYWQASGAPISHAESLSPANPILEIGKMDVERAIERFQQFREVFGMHEPWVLSEPVAELDVNDLPAWYGR